MIMILREKGYGWREYQLHASIKLITLWCVWHIVLSNRSFFLAPDCQQALTLLRWTYRNWTEHPAPQVITGKPQLEYKNPSFSPFNLYNLWSGLAGFIYMELWKVGRGRPGSFTWNMKGWSGPAGFIYMEYERLVRAGGVHSHGIWKVGQGRRGSFTWNMKGWSGPAGFIYMEYERLVRAGRVHLHGTMKGK